MDRHFDAAGARAEAAIGSASPFLSAPSPLIVMSHVLSCLGVSPSPSLHAALRKKWREGRGREGLSKFISPVLCLKVGLSFPSVAESPLGPLGRRGRWTTRAFVLSQSSTLLSARYARFPSFDLRVALTNKGNHVCEQTSIFVKEISSSCPFFPCFHSDLVPNQSERLCFKSSVGRRPLLGVYPLFLSLKRGEEMLRKYERRKIG